jgi:cellulose biosynthesis protein BcsQ
VSETLERTDAEVASKPDRLVVICSPKGGTGKTSLARNLLVAAGQADIPSAGIDFDQQGSLAKWHARRAKTRETYPTFVPVDVVPGRLTNWRGAIKGLPWARLVVADLPPTVEHDLPMVTALCAAADFVLVPTSATADDLDSVLPWMPGLFNAQFMTRMARIASTPPKAMRCRASVTLRTSLKRRMLVANERRRAKMPGLQRIRLASSAKLPSRT